MKKTLAIILLGLTTIFGHAEKVDPKDLLGLQYAVYSEEIPVTIVYMRYDTDGDGRDDIMEIYQTKMAEDGSIFLTRQLAEFIDRDRDGIYSESERNIIVDLEREVREQELKELLSKTKPFQRTDCI